MLNREIIFSPTYANLSASLTPSKLVPFKCPKCGIKVLQYLSSCIISDGRRLVSWWEIETVEVEGGGGEVRWDFQRFMSVEARSMSRLGEGGGGSVRGFSSFVVFHFLRTFIS